ncbi:MAG: LURP-one-related family protein [Bacteroidota bacterium]
MKNYQTYRLKERNLSLRDKYEIENEDGDTIYEVKGKWLSWGDKLTVKKPDGTLTLMIDQKQMSWRSKYAILKDGEEIAEVSKKAGFFKQKLEIEFADGTEYEVKGNFLDREFEVKDGRKTVAEVSKKWLSLSDTYGVRVAASEDAAIILAVVIIIDLMLQEEEGEE